ncbi:MAG: hypothetical protein ACLPVF_15130 [Acidimicrobiales bacterium]
MSMSYRFQTGRHGRTGGEAGTARPRPTGGRSPHTTLLITDPRQPERFVQMANPPWLRLRARLCAPSLDRRLASGRAPESHRLLAARAGQLVSPTLRTELAQNWRDLLELARRAPARNRCVPLCRDRIVAAEGAVQSMLSALSAPRPASARGVAMASVLLSDGTGLLYNHHCAADLRHALAEVTAQLDPEGSLTGTG